MCINNIVKNHSYVTIKPMRQLVFILMLVCTFGFFGVADAQLSNLPQTEIVVQMIPENPKPNDTVSVLVNSYATNIDTAKITWKINGKTMKSGTGEKNFSFKVGGMNTTTTLGIVIETSGGETINKTYNIKPTSVDLIWESEGFVPPFYKGKSLFSHQNKITITAVPHITNSSGQEIGAYNLVYKWKKNGSVIDGASGFGKNSYSFISSLISRPFSIEVDVSTVDSDATGYARIDLAPSEPFVLFYKKDPIYGIEFQKALQNNVELKNSVEITTIGIPMFFGTTDPNAPELNYKWYINGTPIDSGSGLSTQVFRQKEGTSGTSNISLSIENSKKILQYASGNFNLMFGSSNQ